MNWDEYSNWVATRVNLTKARVTSASGQPNQLPALLGFLGLAGEAGEVVDLGKKHLMHGKQLRIESLIEELGDVFWYLALLMKHYDIPLEEILDYNKKKLEARDGTSGETFHIARGVAP